MRVAALGLDVGGKRIGVAGCDGLGMMATGITTIWRSSFDRDIAQLAEIIADRQVEILVLGLPYTMDGAIGSQAKQVQKFGRRVAAGLGLPIEYVDERLTSYAAQAVYDGLIALEPQTKAAQSSRNYQQLIDALAQLTPAISSFFDGEDSVLVMDSNPEIKTNRLNLLGLVRNHARVLADFGSIVK